MPTKVKTGSTKSGTKRSTKPSTSKSSSKSKTTPRPTPKQHKPLPTTLSKSKSSSSITKRKPPHLRYSASQLKIPHLNGIRPAGVQKLPNKKKGKKFVDDGEGMRTILALVMAEKEGNIESRMMRARQLEEVREARRVEGEKRAEGKRVGFEERKEGIRSGGRRGKRGREDEERGEADGEKSRDGGDRTKKPRKKVSFG